MQTDFEARVDSYRRDLVVHCYRMVGSVQDAEDLVQETMLRAWRARDRYDDRLASIRTWLYTIAASPPSPRTAARPAERMNCTPCRCSP